MRTTVIAQDNLTKKALPPSGLSNQQEAATTGTLDIPLLSIPTTYDNNNHSSSRRRRFFWDWIVNFKR